MLDISVLTYADDLAVAKRSVHDVIAQRSLRVAYQPIVDHVHHEVLGYEALTRPVMDGHLIQPDLWFRAAYDCQRSLEADLLALSRIFENTASLPGEIVPKPLFVNAMPSSLAHPDFLDGIERMIDQGVFRPEQMVLEIVEYVDYDPRSLADVVRTLRSFGIRIALDDFGVKGVGVEAISELKPDFVKIDRSLIQGISKCASRQKWLKNLIQQTASENCFIVAEGIENAEDLLAVKETGVRCSQGYYWGQPAPSKELADLILQIESERKILANIFQDRQGILTDPEVLKKSCEIDRLITQYHCLSGQG